MSDLPFYNRIKREAKFDTWGGRTRSPSTRFHHLLLVPEGGFGNWQIATAAHFTSIEPELDRQGWTLSLGKGRDVFVDIHVSEYPNISETHKALIDGLMSITRMGVDYSPEPKGPGDVLILDWMARDNLLLSLYTTDSVDARIQMALLRQIDDWLLGNWPLMASKEKSGNTPSLKVGIRAKSQSVRLGESLELVVEVKKNDTVLDLKTLPHRFLANPGRISWKNNSYIFTSDRRGMSEITLDVAGSEGEYGQGNLKVQVTAK